LHVQELAAEQVDVAFSDAPIPVKKVPATAGAVAMPTAPTISATPAKTEEDIELEKLMAETGMLPS
jgi:hypothetical protein